MSALLRRKSQTSISPGTHLEGDLRSSGDVHLSGVVRGNISARQLSIGPEGCLLGDVIAETVHIQGRVQGKVSASFVALDRGGEVVGEIVYGELSADLGAIIQARCEPRENGVNERMRPSRTSRAESNTVSRSRHVVS